jgi:hypothetical protein
MSSALSLEMETVVCVLLLLLPSAPPSQDVIVAQPMAPIDVIAVHTANKVLFFIEFAPCQFFIPNKQFCLLLLSEYRTLFITRYRKRQTQQYSAPAPLVIRFSVPCDMSCLSLLAVLSLHLHENYNTKTIQCQYPFCKK